MNPKNRTLTKLLFFALLCGSTFLSAQQIESGYAVFYADYFHGKQTAYGETYDKNQMTCAHKFHPPGTLLKVYRQDNPNKIVNVRVTDRGPFTDGYIVDLSRAAAQELGMIQEGRIMVWVQVTGKANIPPPNARPAELYASAPAATYPTPPAPNAYGNSASNVNNLFGIGPNGMFVIQVASYSTYGAAYRQFVLMQGKGVSRLYLDVEEVQFRPTQYKLVIGPFPNQTNADYYLRLMNKRHQVTGMVLKIR